MATDYQALRAALANLPHGWETDWSVIDYGEPDYLDGAQAQYQIGPDCLAYVFEAEYAAYIAAASPDTIRALLSERDALRDALQWYASMSKRMGNASIAGDSQAILALMKDVAVDYGGRARAALADGEDSK